MASPGPLLIDEVAHGGQMGAVNGMSADGKILTNAEAKEVWVGTTLGYAGLLMSEGMQEQAWKSVWGTFNGGGFAVKAAPGNVNGTAP